MTAAERERAARYHFEEDRKRYTAGRSTLRRLLAQSTGIAPSELAIQEAEWTKPRLVLPPDIPSIFFNVSHSGDFVLLAVSDAVEVGVDIEQVRADCPITDLARRYYSPAEFQYLETLPSDRRLRDFYRFWTIKEAVLKCAGLGLSVPPHVVDVRLQDDGRPELHCLDENRMFLAQISVRELAVAEGYASALALKTKDKISINLV